MKEIFEIEEIPVEDEQDVTYMEEICRQPGDWHSGFVRSVYTHTFDNFDSLELTPPLRIASVEGVSAFLAEGFPGPRYDLYYLLDRIRRGYRYFIAYSRSMPYDRYIAVPWKGVHPFNVYNFVRIYLETKADTAGESHPC